MSLQGESTLNHAEKITEFRKHIHNLSDHLEEMTPTERGFVERMTEQLESWGDNTSISSTLEQGVTDGIIEGPL